ncbi:MAG: hypothetical protein IAA31_07225 [Candidatus Anaerobiospirillum merdipullorum]|uniref:Uncharacterized protein n=1 Tax=Candidatus Anaerobiospirillum merdipullorum TaxID=2838450 RepID=A0A9E2KPP7_9GAMM|nr:hypothetical protein [Candidatus Anaerobiospirillum merdipullorum]
MSNKLHSFEPRVGKAQLFFGVCYSLIVIISLVLALYVKLNDLGGEPYMQYFMAALFGLLALKSFYLYRRVQRLITEGVRTQADFVSCESVRGITIVRARTEVEGYGPIEFEQRLAGVRLADEIKRVLAERKQDKLPCLLIDAHSRHPRAMLTIATDHGRLKPESLNL